MRGNTAQLLNAASYQGCLEHKLPQQGGDAGYLHAQTWLCTGTGQLPHCVSSHLQPHFPLPHRTTSGAQARLTKSPSFRGVGEEVLMQSSCREQNSAETDNLSAAQAAARWATDLRILLWHCWTMRSSRSCLPQVGRYLHSSKENRAELHFWTNLQCNHQHCQINSSSAFKPGRPCSPQTSCTLLPAPGCTMSLNMDSGKLVI